MTLLLMKDCGFLEPFGGAWVLHFCISAFLAILFIQSGLDKTIHHRGNLDWLKGHFSTSFLCGAVPLLLAALTFLELASGLLCLVGVFEILFLRTYCFAFAGALVSALTMLSLFFGQRVAKDYAGAAALVPYFIVVLIQLMFLA